MKLIVYTKNGTKDIEIVVTKKIPSHYNYDTETLYVDELYSFNYFHEYAHVMQNKNGFLEVLDRFKELLMYFSFYTLVIFSVLSLSHYVLDWNFQNELLQILALLFGMQSLLVTFHVVPEIHANWWASRLRKKYQNGTFDMNELLEHQTWKKE